MTRPPRKIPMRSASDMRRRRARLEMREALPLFALMGVVGFLLVWLASFAPPG